MFGGKNRVHQPAFLSFFKDARERFTTRRISRRTCIYKYIYTRVVAIGFNNRKRGECWRMEGGEKIGGEIGLTGIALSVSVGLCR